MKKTKVKTFSLVKAKGQHKNNCRFINGVLVLIVQHHMMCSLLEWLSYNVACIV